jgi:hypothetical protein
MSVVSNVHTVTIFDSKTSKAYEGQRLARITYKTVRKGENAGTRKDSKCVSIPAVKELSDTVYQAMEPYMLTLYHSAQDSIIRELIDNGATIILDEQINDAAVLEYLAQEAQGSRLTKEVVISWFNESLADTLTVAFADKLGVSDSPTAEQTKVLEQNINIYRECFAGLAGGKTSYTPEKATKVLRALEIAGDIEGDDIARKFAARLKEMVAKPQGADMLGL